jgi:hypothetical protein
MHQTSRPEIRAIRASLVCLVTAMGCGQGVALPIKTMKPVADQVRSAERVVVELKDVGSSGDPVPETQYELTDPASLRGLAGLFDSNADVDCQEGRVTVTARPMAKVLVYKQAADPKPSLSIEVTESGTIVAYFDQGGGLSCRPVAAPDSAKLFERLARKDFGPAKPPKQ